MWHSLNIYTKIMRCIALFCCIELVTACSQVYGKKNITETVLPAKPILSTDKAYSAITPTPIEIESTPTGFTLTIEQEPAENINKTSLPTYSFSGNKVTWQKLPIIPKPSQKVLEIYELGLALGNNPRAFSKIGDCGSTPTWFLGDFDRGEQYYSLGDEYAYLDNVIDYFKGSFNRTSLAAKSGFNVSSVLTPIWSDKTQCNADESPLACEYRIQKPILAFITLGANDVYHLNTFEAQMRQIVEFSVDHGVIPVLSTKPDNIEKNHQINATIARIAEEYDIPLWNYWLAVQPLPNHGLQEDGVHITWRANWFDKKETFNWGWPVRNLTALQVLNEIWILTTENASNQ